MIKNNNKGFVITEVLILSTVILGVLTLMYIQFKSVNRSYQYSFKYDTVEGLYLANNIVNYINDGNYDNLVEQVNSNPKGYIDITECTIENSTLISYCNSLFQKSEIEKILFTKENLIDLKRNISDFDNDMQNYIKQIKTLNDEKDYRIIVKYKDGSFTTMRFNKGNEYVQSGLIAYLDGINNTGFGHSDDTQTWKDLSNHGNDAILYNTPTWSNNSLTFNGQNNYGRLENTTNIEFTNGVTIEARAKIISIKGTEVEFFNNYEGAGLGISYDASISRYVSWIYANNSWISQNADNETSEIGEYYTTTLTYNNSELKQYINGKEVKSTTIGNNAVIKKAPVPFTLGGNPNTTGGASSNNVEFQNVLIYDRALSENEVMRNYQADLARY